jgi:hypothetical protein
MLWVGLTRGSHPMRAPWASGFAKGLRVCSCWVQGAPWGRLDALGGAHTRQPPYEGAPRASQGLRVCSCWSAYGYLAPLHSARPGLLSDILGCARVLKHTGSDLEHPRPEATSLAPDPHSRSPHPHVELRTNLEFIFYPNSCFTSQDACFSPKT